MGSNVLIYTRDTSLCKPLYADLVACRSQGAVEEELRARIPHQAGPRQVEIGLDEVDVERFHWIRIVGVGRENDDEILLTTRHHI